MLFTELILTYTPKYTFVIYRIQKIPSYTRYGNPIDKMINLTYLVRCIFGWQSFFMKLFTASARVLNNRTDYFLYITFFTWPIACQFNRNWISQWARAGSLYSSHVWRYMIKLIFPPFCWILIGQILKLPISHRLSANTIYF